MEQTTAKVTIRGVTEEYPLGISYSEIVEKYQKEG